MAERWLAETLAASGMPVAWSTTAQDHQAKVDLWVWPHGRPVPVQVTVATGPAVTARKRDQLAGLPVVLLALPYRLIVDACRHPSQHRRAEAADRLRGLVVAGLRRAPWSTQDAAWVTAASRWVQPAARNRQQQDTIVALLELHDQLGGTLAGATGEQRAAFRLALDTARQAGWGYAALGRLLGWAPSTVKAHATRSVEAALRQARQARGRSAVLPPSRTEALTGPQRRLVERIVALGARVAGTGGGIHYRDGVELSDLMLAAREQGVSVVLLAELLGRRPAKVRDKISAARRRRDRRRDRYERSGLDRGLGPGLDR